MTDSTKKKRRSQRPIAVTWRRLKKNKLATLGLIVILIMIFLAIIAPEIMPYKIDALDLKNKLQGPSSTHWLGTDELGRDILSRLLYGSRFSLEIGIIGVLVSAGGGIVIGAIAGYFGGTTDNIVMRIMDVLQAMPGIVLAIAISATLGPGLVNCIIALSI